mgnify:CR=1 FL=1
MNIKEILFWIFLFISMGLLIWTVFGNSPTEFAALAGLIFTLMLKMWSIGERQVRLEMRFNGLVKDFKNLAKDFKEHINENKKGI